LSWGRNGLRNGSAGENAAVAATVIGIAVAVRTEICKPLLVLLLLLLLVLKLYNHVVAESPLTPGNLALADKIRITIRSISSIASQRRQRRYLSVFRSNCVSSIARAPVGDAQLRNSNKVATALDTRLSGSAAVPLALTLGPYAASRYDATLLIVGRSSPHR
jgi:hypothetical protein